MTLLTADDPRLGLAGHAELVLAGGLVRPCRLPSAGPSAVLPPELLAAARMPSGVRAEFMTDARGFSWQVRADPKPGGERPAAPFDVSVDGALFARVAVAGEGTLRVDGLPGGEKRVTVWLPQAGSVGLGALRLDDGASAAAAGAGPDWIAYGSSLTHCTGADGPSETWPALVAARHGWRLRNLGFAGECHLDPVAARLMRDSPADFLSLCVGVNIHGKASFTRRTLGPALAGFLATVRDGHPDTPIVLMTPIAAPEREHARNEADLTLADVRALVADLGAALRAAGDPALHVVDGRDVLGEGDAGLLADGLHPTAAGYRLMAERLGPRLLHLSGLG